MADQSNEMGMIERVARAICASRGRNPDECVFGSGWAGPNGSGSTCSKRAWEEHKSEARAAIEAMREPSDGMARAFWRGYERKITDMASPAPTEYPDDGGGTFGYGYRAALDAALQEKPPAT